MYKHTGRGCGRPAPPRIEWRVWGDVGPPRRETQHAYRQIDRGYAMHNPTRLAQPHTSRDWGCRATDRQGPRDAQPHKTGPAPHTRDCVTLITRTSCSGSSRLLLPMEKGLVLAPTSSYSAASLCCCTRPGSTYTQGQHRGGMWSSLAAPSCTPCPAA